MKLWGGRFESGPSEVFERFSGSLHFDRRLIEADELVHFAQTSVKVDIDETRLRPNDVPVVQGDATRIRAELGWSPKIRVEQTLLDTLEYWRAEVAAGR